MTPASLAPRSTRAETARRDEQIDTPAAPIHLSVKGVAKRFRQTPVLVDLDLEVRQGEIISLLGPSGCGKTTLLRAIAGLVPVDAGRISVGGGDITHQPPHLRNVGVVFQSYALFPHLTVRGNIAIGLKAKRWPGTQIAARVEEMLALVRLKDLAERPITALSGGQQQRVAVARALAVAPSLLLLDEPFSALDRKLREDMQVDLRRLLADRGITAIFVTHDQEEAMVLSDRIAVMRNGQIEQFADATTLYRAPASRFVFEFVGQSTVLSGTVLHAADGLCQIQTALGVVRAPAQFLRGAAVAVCLRPEALGLKPPAGAPFNRVSCPLRHISFFGSRALIYGEVAGPDRMLVEIDARDLAAIGTGAPLELYWDLAAAQIFPADTLT
jgi:putative spermidine/putrescine transport system ATP-binding protein